MYISKPISNVLLVILIGMTVLSNIEIAAQENCTFTATVDIEDIPLYGAPLVDDNLIITRIATQVAYDVVRDEAVAGMFFIRADDTLSGWVDRRSGGLEGECAFFDAPPSRGGSMSGLTGICEFTIDEPIPFYVDASLTERMDDEGAHTDELSSGTYPTSHRNADSVYVYFGHAMSGGYVDLDDVELNPECEPIIPPETIPDEPLAEATALLNARLWTQPDVESGQVSGFLTEDREVYILSEPVSGIIRRDTLVEGDWYYVTTTTGSLAGWVWEGRLAITWDE